MTYRSLRGSYVRLAVEVLRAAREPLGAAQILAEARQRGLMPPHLHGKTPHKTLNARLSEHIRHFRDDAEIFRVGPAKYFVTELLQDPTIPKQYKRKFRGVLRSKQVRHERVLVADVPLLVEQGISGFVPFNSSWFSSQLRNNFRFLERRNAEKREDVKQFISYALVVRDNSILSYRRGTFSTAPEELKGLCSVGFGGHINETDFDLFSFDYTGIIRNIARELHEELFITDIDIIDSVPTPNVQVVGLINVNDTPEARKHVAVVIIYQANGAFDFRKGELSINQIGWFNVSHRVNDLRDFELWSEIILRKLFDGTLSIERSPQRD